MNIRCPSCSNALSVGGHSRVQCPYCRTVIDTGASAGPAASFSLGGPGSSTGPASQGRPRGRSGGSGLQMIVVGCVLLMLIGGGVIVGLTVLRKPDKDKGPTPEQPIALTKAQEVVAKHYHPAKVKFDDKPTLRKIQDSEWKVESFVQFHDRGGTLRKASYSARVWLEGENDWRVELLEIGGQRVFDSPPPSIVKDSGDTQTDTPTPPEPEREERTVSRAMRTLGGAIDEAAALRKTLVVWLFDTSPSATAWREEVTRSFETVYAELRKHKTVGKSVAGKNAAEKNAAGDDAAGGEASKLQIAVVTFDDMVQVLTDQPLADETKLREILGKISEGQGGHERPFAAMQKALEKFGDFAKQGGRLQFVVVTDEAGDDEEKVIETTIPALKKAGVQVYAIGKESPWGQAAWPTSRFGSQAAGGSDPLHQGPESLFPERVNLQFWERGFGEEMIGVPSGFGPYQLCRVCRETQGAFFIGDGGERGGWGDRDGGFDPKTRARYEPKYLSADESRKFLASNGAARALHEAAKVPSFDLVKTLTLDFLAGDEARLKQQLDRAQQGVARTEPKLNELYEALRPGITDRPKLTEPRLQAGFDLAIGRVLATQARVEGYNAMLANLKGGKRFKNAGSSTWVLQAADQTTAGSKYDKAIKDAHMYLERVVKEHPNTPWAKDAQRELQSKMGWEWGER
jgi:hypothetical protein